MAKQVNHVMGDKGIGGVPSACMAKQVNHIMGCRRWLGDSFCMHGLGGLIYGSVAVLGCCVTLLAGQLDVGVLLIIYTAVFMENINHLLV